MLEEGPSGGVQVHRMDSRGATQGPQGGDHTASAEAKQGDVANGGDGEARGGEDVKDAVRGTGLAEDLAENGTVLGDAPASVSPSNRWACAGRGHASNG